MSRALTKKVQARKRRRFEHQAEGGVSGAIAGAAAGAVAGPPGAVAGAIVGGVVGVFAGEALSRDSVDTALRDARLDEEIGISGGDLGAPNLEHPPAKTGAYSGASSGAGGGRISTPAEGPMQPPDS